MIYTLAIILIGLLYLKRVNTSPFILSPSTILILLFLLSLCVDIFIRKDDICVETAIVIFTGILMFLLGDVLAYNSFKTKAQYKLQKYNLYIPLKLTSIVLVFMIIVTYFDYIELRNYAGTSEGGLFVIVTIARTNSYIEGEVFSHSFFLLQCLYACKVISFIYLYVFMYRYFVLKKRSWLYLIPFLIVFVQEILSTGRNGIIYLLYALMVTYYFAIQNSNGWKHSNDRRFIMWMSIPFSMFIVLFLYMSFMRKDGDVDLVENFSTYFGGSIYVLDKYVETYGLDAKASYFGEQTQVLYYSILNALGLSSQKAVVVLPMMPHRYGESNIYTAFGRYIHDYGLYGLMIITFLLGFCYTYLYNKLRNRTINGLYIVLYILITYPITQMSIEERFFCDFLTARSFYNILYAVIAYKLLVFGKKDKIGCPSLRTVPNKVSNVVS